MSTASIRHRFALIAAVMLCQALYACREQNAPQEQRKAAAPQPAAEAQPEPDVHGPGSVYYTINSADGKRVMSIGTMGSDVVIELGEPSVSRTLVGRLKGTDKRRYELKGSGPIAEVKLSGENFKLKSPDGKLLWKVKISEPKVKISDNEENQRPLEIYYKEDHLKVEDNGAKIGSIHLYAQKNEVKVKDATGKELYNCSTTLMSAMFGPLLTNRIPETERAIIMAELLSNAR